MSDGTSLWSPPPSPFQVAADLLFPEPADPERVERAQTLAGSLREFMLDAWPIVEPGTHFYSSWHIDAICEHLEACTRREIRKLIINVPPRTTKSRTVSVMWPAWTWLTQPETRWLFASYAADLAIDLSVDCRTIIESEGGRDVGGTLMEQVGYRGILSLLLANRPWWVTDKVDPAVEAELWENDQAARDWAMVDDLNLKTRFQNTRRGSRLATSVGAKVTGFGGDFIVADDPHNASDVMSDLKRQAALDWWDKSMSTRLNDPKRGVRVVVMQRLHEQDLTGHLIEKGGWEHLCLPMEYEPKHPFVWPDDPRTEPGDLLLPDRFGTEEVDQLKVDLGAYGAAGQLQQRPSPGEGGIIKRAWWRFYPPADDVPILQSLTPKQVWTSWDTALKEKTTSDYTVGIAWAQDEAMRYLLRIVRGQWGFTEALAQMLSLHAWLVELAPTLTPSHYVESAAMGKELMAAARLKIPGLVPLTASVDKVARTNAITPFLEGGNVLVPGYRKDDGQGYEEARTPASTQLLIEECSAFPNGANDDQVDAFVYGIDPRRWMAAPVSPRKQKEEARRRGRMGGMRTRQL